MNERQSMLYAINKLSISLSHMNDFKYIDAQCYWITINLNANYKENIFYISQSIFKSINHAFDSSRGKNIAKKNSLLVDFDVEGSRQRNTEERNNLYPHLHGLIIINKEICDNFNSQEIISNIDSSIKNYNNTSIYISQTKIDVFNNKDKSVLTYIDYISKLGKQIPDEPETGPILFPYDSQICNKSQRAKDITFRNASEIASMLLDETSGIFTPEHHRIVMDHYRSIDLDYVSAATDEERQSCKSKFLSGVFSDPALTT
ncbi:hypothetical protein EDF68_101545 [Ochrobactrum sp. BH3]|nr:hypothetical protein EDF68_101545 [Ochrobactrum sp. BH3]